MPRGMRRNCHGPVWGAERLGGALGSGWGPPLGRLGGAVGVRVAAPTGLFWPALGAREPAREGGEGREAATARMRTYHVPDGAVRSWGWR